jgi:hypothetical protein
MPIIAGKCPVDNMWVTRFFWGEKRIDLTFWHQRCRMLIGRHNNFRGRY